MVKAVQKFHDKINAAPRSSGQIGKDWPDGRPGGRKGEGRIEEAATRNASLLLLLTMISLRDFVEREEPLRQSSSRNVS